MEDRSLMRPRNSRTRTITALTLAGVLSMSACQLTPDSTSTPEPTTPPGPTTVPATGDDPGTPAPETTTSTAPVTTGSTATPDTTVAPTPDTTMPDTTMPDMGGGGMADMPGAELMPEVDTSKIPASNPGFSGYPDLDELIPSNPGPAGDGVGAFRTECDYSHMNFDDPIVYPGRPGASHLHVFFGNTGTDASSTDASIATSGNSTCEGGIANRSAYWVPALIDTRTNAPIEPHNPSAGGGDPEFMSYYKRGYFPGITNEMIQNIPQGLRIISGATTFASADPYPGLGQWARERSTTWSCNGSSGNTIPSGCAGAQRLDLSVAFPQCWDGVNLDSADHRSHMAWPAQNGCPASHPVVLPQLTVNVHYEIPAGTDPARDWRLSSDMYDPATGAPGASLHSDFIAGWDPGHFDRAMDTCVRAGNTCG